MPAIVEWPNGVAEPRVSSFPASTMDIFPTVASIAGISEAAALQPQDGIDLRSVFAAEPERRGKPIGFRHGGRLALVDNDLKIVRNDPDSDSYEVYNLARDPGETTDISTSSPADATRLRAALDEWNESVEESATGNDYPADDFDPEESKPKWWMTQDGYAPYVDEWRSRPEYARYIERELGKRE